MDNSLFREAMGQFATGITVVTSDYQNELHGITVNAFMSVSLEPKLIAISIDESASMYEILQKTDNFGVSLLSDKQKELSMVFAKQKEMEQEIPIEQLGSNPVLKGSLAMLSCRIKDRVRAGDHMIFIAEVTEISVNKGEPLLYFGSNYRSLVK